MGVGPVGGTTHFASVTEGSVKEAEEDPDAFWTLTTVDLPRYLPVDDTQMPVTVNSGEHFVSLKRKRRGEEEFSSLDTTRLPFFTRVEITTHRYVTKHLEIVAEVLEYLDGLADLVETSFEPLANIDHLTVRAYVLSASDRSRFVARTTYPMTGELHFPRPDQSIELTPQLQEELARYRSELASLAEERRKSLGDVEFRTRLFDAFESFVFSARQHARSLQSLGEDIIRDLFLIVLKGVFGSAEGEAFNATGKTDIEITNPDDRYEFYVMEFKWWNGELSWRKAYSQAVNEHSTGQESGLYILILSKNKDAGQVATKLRELCASEAQTTRLPEPLDSDSGEFFLNADVVIRGKTIPLTIGLADLYYTNPRAENGTGDSAAVGSGD